MPNQYWAQTIEQDEEWSPACIMTNGFESAAESMVQEFVEATSGEIKFGLVKVWEFDGEHPITKIYSWEANF